MYLSFSLFRPSWSSSTPAYGTLLPWGRTMRRPLPVSPPPFFFSFLIYFLCAFRCRFRHTAKPALTLSPSLSSPSHHVCISISISSLFISLKRRQYLHACQKDPGLIVWCTAWHGLRARGYVHSEKHTEPLIRCRGRVSSQSAVISIKRTLFTLSKLPDLVQNFPPLNVNN